jgi:hypothetical protein
MILAIVVAIAVPVSSLRTTYKVAHCCCPDPIANCHCPHDKTPTSQAPTLRTCHHDEALGVSPELASFTPAHPARVVPPAGVDVPVRFFLDTPHPAPFPAWPDAPS